MRLTLLPLLLLLAACQAAGPGSAQDARAWAGAILELHQGIEIPADQAGAFIRGTPIGDRYRYDAACRLELRTVSATSRTVRADRFAVERADQISELFSERPSGLRPARFYRFRDGPHLLTFTTYLYLRSDRQPDVFRLACAHLQSSDRNPRHPTESEIRTVLAPIISVH